MFEAEHETSRVDNVVVSMVVNQLLHRLKEMLVRHAVFLLNGLLDGIVLDNAVSAKWNKACARRPNANAKATFVQSINTQRFLRYLCGQSVFQIKTEVEITIRTQTKISVKYLNQTMMNSKITFKSIGNPEDTILGLL